MPLEIKGSLQENLITLICYDKQSLPILINTVSPTIFSHSVFRQIAEKALGYYTQFKEPIGDHILDEFETVLNGKDKREARVYSQTFEDIKELSSNINRDYVLAQLNKFVRLQNFKGALIKAVDLLKSDLVSTEDLDNAENIITNSLKNRIDTFNPGLFFTDTSRSFDFLKRQQDGLLFGIHNLDCRGLRLFPGTMTLFLAPTKRGKTWFLIHLGKYALLQRKKVLHITLELNENDTCQRYFQSIFSVAEEQANIETVTFKKDSLQRLLAMKRNKFKSKLSFDQKDIQKVLTVRVHETIKGKRSPLLIKEFPMNQLTFPALVAYVNTLVDVYKFVPDLVLLDYPERMKLSTQNYRLDIGKLFESLRGLASEMGFALAVVGQGNRASVDAKLNTETSAAESFDKIATADTVITYTQTEQEHKLGLARLFVSNARKKMGRYIVLLSQNYSIGQFRIDDVFFSKADRSKIVGEESDD